MTMKWIKCSEKKWNCDHMNKCDVFIDCDGELYLYSTDFPEPTKEYRYAFLDYHAKGYLSLIKSDRIPLPCDCQPERLSEKTSMNGDWISVKDKLPLNEQEVIVSDEYGSIEIRTYYEEDINGKHFVDIEFCSYGDILFWMPLPNKPNIEDAIV